MSNEYIANLLGVSQNTASTAVSKLIKLGLVEVTKFDGRMRFLKSCVCYNQKADFGEIQRQTLENSKHNKQDYINNISVCNNARARKFDFAWALRGAGVTEQHVAEWMEIRKTKKATNSQTAFDALVRESAKAGLSVDEAVTKCIEESWKGFRAIYMEDRSPIPAARPASQPKESLVEHNRKAAEEVLRRLAGK